MWLPSFEIRQSEPGRLPMRSGGRSIAVALFASAAILPACVIFAVVAFALMVRLAAALAF